MRQLLLAATAFALIAEPTQAATIGDAVKADMPSLMAIYRDFHANPELSMQEVRTAAKLAAEAKKLGFDRHREGRQDRRRRGAARTAPARSADPRRHGRPAGRSSRPAFPSPPRSAPSAAVGVETGVMHACGHDTHMTSWIGTARRLAAR